MISADALKEREWGHLPALRQVLQDAPLSEHYYGWTSASDTIFDQVSRLMKQAILLREHNDKIIETAASIGKEEVRKDLRLLESAFADVAAQFESARRMAGELGRSL